MFSLTLRTLRTTREAKLPRAAGASCGHSWGQGLGMAPVTGGYRSLALYPVASSLGATDLGMSDRAISNRIERAFPIQGAPQ